jgi:stage II sporulation protein D
MRSVALGVLLVVAVTASPGAAAAQAESPRAVLLVPDDGTVFVIDGRAYGGAVEVRAASDGVVVIEHVGLDDYLGGIREVPFSWPAETLRAQAVAARTYLAWSLNRGRAGAGRTYGFDICASTACQVYRGSAGSAGPDGDRWHEAVAATAGEILVFGSAPAQTLYSSSAGSRTRANQDVFGGAAKPYLQPTDSPEAGVTPYEEWRVDLPAVAFVRILERAGYAVGSDVRHVTVVGPAEGEGASRLVVETDQGRTSLNVADVRWLFNEHGPKLYPGLLPAPRPDGRRWPQAVLSYTFVAAFTPPATPAALHELLPVDDAGSTGRVTFVGEGWGHGVGMSQWGAKAMGDEGASYVDILAHYYGGLVPQPGDDYLPDEVAVGLGWGEPDVVVAVRGAFHIVLDGGRSRAYRDGSWRFVTGTSGLTVEPPVSVSLPSLPGGVALR